MVKICSIRIGVTGHRRRLPPEDILKQRVREVLSFELWNESDQHPDGSIFTLFDDAMIEAYRNKKIDLRFSFLTPLAEGADRLITEEAYHLMKEKLEVEAILPFPAEEYKKDFEGDHSIREFEKWLERAKQTIIICEVLETERELVYERTGRYVVDQSDLLLALWDGKKARGKGGTQEVVDYAKQIGKPVIILSANSPFDIYCVRGKGLSKLEIMGD